MHAPETRPIVKKKVYFLTSNSISNRLISSRLQHQKSSLIERETS